MGDLIDFTTRFVISEAASPPITIPPTGVYFVVKDGYTGRWKEDLFDGARFRTVKIVSGMVVLQLEHRCGTIEIPQWDFNEFWRDEIFERVKGKPDWAF